MRKLLIALAAISSAGGVGAGTWIATAPESDPYDILIAKAECDAWRKGRELGPRFEGYVASYREGCTDADGWAVEEGMRLPVALGAGFGGLLIGAVLLHGAARSGA